MIKSSKTSKTSKSFQGTIQAMQAKIVAHEQEKNKIAIELKGMIKKLSPKEVELISKVYTQDIEALQTKLYLAKRTARENLRSIGIDVVTSTIGHKRNTNLWSFAYARNVKAITLTIGNKLTHKGKAFAFPITISKGKKPIITYHDRCNTLRDVSLFFALDSKTSNNVGYVITNKLIGNAKDISVIGKNGIALKAIPTPTEF